MKLREYQLSAIDKIRDALRRGLTRLMIYSPTGSGKTVIASEIMRLAEEKAKRVIFVVNRITLVRQASKHLKSLDMIHGIVQGDNTWGVNRNILVCSIQTLARRGFPEADLVVVDEAHGATSETYRRLFKHYAGIKILGLSATPFTKGLARDYGFGKLFEELVIAATIPELIEKGFLVDCEIYAPPGPDLSAVPIVRGDYDEEKLAVVMDKTPLIGDIVDHWTRLAKGRSTILFATNILHSKHCCEEFNDRGIRAEHIDCFTSDDDRDAIFDRFENGVTLVICNVDVCSEGWNAPRASCMILARPTRKLTRYIQRAGRVLRPYPGKQMALILDHSTTSLRLGYPTDELPLELDDGKPAKKSERAEKEELLPRPCPKCHFLIPPKVYPCPKCGFAMLAQNKVHTASGKLTKLQRKYLFTPEQLQEFWSGCLGLAEKRKKERGWAAYLFKDITHRWPNGLENIACIPCEKILKMDKHNRIKQSFMRNKT